jgi:AcrR family transcriptional regulator
MTEEQPAISAEGRGRILYEAERLFSARGFKGVSIRDIARACGVSNAAIYYHFENKQELYVQMLAASLRRMGLALEAAAQEPGTCRERLHRMASTHARLALDKRSLAQFAIRDLVSLGPEAVREALPRLRAQVPAVVEAVLRQGIDAGEIKPVDASLASDILLGMLNALNSHMLLGLRDEPDEDGIDLIIDVFLNGIAAGGAKP